MTQFLQSKNAKIWALVIAVIVVALIAYFAFGKSLPPEAAIITPATTTPEVPAATGTKPKPAPAGTVTAPAPTTPAGIDVTIHNRTYTPSGWTIAFVLPADWKVSPSADTTGKVTRLVVAGGDTTANVSKDIVIAKPTSGKSVTSTEMIFGQEIQVSTYDTNVSYFTIHKDAADYYFRVEANRGNPEELIAVLESID